MLHGLFIVEGKKKFIKRCVISWLMILTQEKEGRKKVEKGKRKGKYRKNEVHIMVKKRERGSR